MFMTGIDVTETSTEAKHTLGTKVSTYDVTDGIRHWIYVEAGTVLEVGDIAITDPSQHTTNPLWTCEQSATTTAAPATLIHGVAQHEIASGSFGFIQCYGKALVKNGTGNITADTAITSGGSRVGSAIDFADGAEECVIGFSLEAEATDNTTFDAFLKIM